jgi:hypothetical protein
VGLGGAHPGQKDVSAHRASGCLSFPGFPDRLMSACDPALVWALMFHGPGCI